MRASAARWPEEEAGRKLTEMIRAFPAWARRNKAEFGLVFGTPPPVSGHIQREINLEWSTALGALYGESYIRWWRTSPFPVPADDELDPALRGQLERYRDQMGLWPLPLGAVLVFVECWSRIYASTCLEVFAHLSVVFTEMNPMHERMCQELCAHLGIPYEPPPEQGNETRPGT